MTEWNIVTVIVVIVGLIGTVAAPLVKNTRAMTQLSGEIKNLIYRIEINEKETDELKVKASSRHKQIFERLDEQGEKLNNHEGRISALEHEHKEDKQ
jgi:cell division protein FtsL